MSNIPEPAFESLVPADAITAAQAVLESALPDKIHILGGQGLAGVVGKYHAHFRAGVNPREMTEAVTQRIANRVSYTVKLPAAAMEVLGNPKALTYRARGFIKDLATGNVQEVYPLEIVSILPMASWGYMVKVIAVVSG